MANTNPDIELVIGVDSGNSYSLMKDGINQVLRDIESKDAPKIKIRLDDTEINNKLQSLRNQITELNSQKISINIAGLDVINNSIIKVSDTIANISGEIKGVFSSQTSFNPLSTDQSALQRLETILNDINNVMRNSDTTRLSGEISAVGTVAQRAAIYLGMYRDALSDTAKTKVYTSLTDLGIAAKDAEVISQHLSDMNIKVKSITPEWETITRAIDGEIVKQQRLNQITVQGTTVLGDAVNHVIKFSTKTGDISKEITKATIKGRELVQTVRELSDGAKGTKPTKVIDFSIDEQKINAALDTIRRRFGELKAPSDEAVQSISNLNAAYERFSKATNQDEKKRELTEVNKLIGITNQRIAEQEVLQRRANAAGRQATQKAVQDSRKQNRVEQEANSQRSVALELLTKITRAQKEWTKARNGTTSNEYARLQNYVEQLNDLLSQFDAKTMLSGQFSARVKAIGDAFTQTSSAIRTAGEDTRGLADRFGFLTSKFSMWFSATRVIMMVYANIRKMISASIDLDKSMTQLQIVTKENDGVMAKFGNTAAEAARRIGSSITDFVSSATTYARLGYSLDESSQLAEFTAMLQNVGDIDVSEAQEAITSIVKAFNIGTDQIESVMDKMVISGNNFPISVSQIAEGMKNASSALAAAGNSFDQSVALLTAANTTIDLCRVA